MHLLSPKEVLFISGGIPEEHYPSPRDMHGDAEHAEAHREVANSADAEQAEAELATPVRSAVVVADGDVPSRIALDAAWPGWLDREALVIAADGGWRKALGLGLRPALLVGDADSLGAETFAEAETAGVETIRALAAKDESDTELAVIAALSRGACHITILGALGGRLDHTIANLSLLALPDGDGIRVEVLDGRTRVRLLSAAPGPAGTDSTVTLPLLGAVGEIVSLLPFGPTAEGVTTNGLLYPLRDEPLPTGPARGLSNIRIEPDASVSLRAGRLLVIETKPLEGETR